LFKGEKFITLEGHTNYPKIFTYEKTESKMIMCVEKLVGNLKNLIIELFGVFYDIFDGKHQITNNFDIAESTIRRGYEQLIKMFISPERQTTLTHPEEVITDPTSRKIWVDTFGQECYMVAYDEFQKKIPKQILEDSEIRLSAKQKTELKSTMQFFIHFPANGIITPYSFHLLGCHWGPHKDIASNLQQYALKQGFLGMMNSYSAEELLTNYPEKHLLVRFSRLYPELLTITLNDGKTKTNKRKAKDVGIKAFLKKEGLDKYEKVPLRLDWATLKTKNTISTYVICNDNYIISSSQNKEEVEEEVDPHKDWE